MNGQDTFDGMSFEQRVLLALSTVPAGALQRIDGLRCEAPLIKHDWWFFRRRLDRMVRKGLLRSRSIGSFWPSCDGMPGYGLTDAGRAKLPVQP